MPYNNTPIAPSQEVSGQVSLPLARVQKIINADQERTHVSKNASFAIALATEMFIQHLATTTHNVVKAERKPRRNIQYRDVATAVAKTDNLEFLVDVVPRTTTYGEFKRKQKASGAKVANGKAAAGKEKEAEKEADAGAGAQEVNGNGDAKTNGETNGVSATPKLQNGHAEEEKADERPEPMDVDDDATQPAEESEPEEDGAAMQIEMEMRGPRTNGTSPVTRRSGGGVSGFTAINGSR